MHFRPGQRLTDDPGYICAKSAIERRIGNEYVVLSASTNNQPPY